MSNRKLAALFVCICLPAIVVADSVVKSGIVPNNNDPAVRPQDDLFRSVNGKWLREAHIPGDRPADGAFIMLRDRSEMQTRDIIQDAARIQGDPDAQKINDLFTSFMDEGRAEELGMKPIQPDLDAVAAIKDKASFIRAVAALQRTGGNGLFFLFVNSDAKRSDQNIAYVGQSGLGLPDESY